MDTLNFTLIHKKGVKGKKIIFTAKEYPELDNVITISKYKKRGEMQTCLLDKNS